MVDVAHERLLEADNIGPPWAAAFRRNPRRQIEQEGWGNQGTGLLEAFHEHGIFMAVYRGQQLIEVEGKRTPFLAIGMLIGVPKLLSQGQRRLQKLGHES